MVVDLVLAILAFGIALILALGMPSNRTGGEEFVVPYGEDPADRIREARAAKARIERERRAGKGR